VTYENINTCQQYASRPFEEDMIQLTNSTYNTFQLHNYLSLTPLEKVPKRTRNGKLADSRAKPYFSGILYSLPPVNVKK